MEYPCDTRCEKLCGIPFYRKCILPNRGGEKTKYYRHLRNVGNIFCVFKHEMVKTIHAVNNCYKQHQMDWHKNVLQHNNDSIDFNIVCSENQWFFFSCLTSCTSASFTSWNNDMFLFASCIQIFLPFDIIMTDSLYLWRSCFKGRCRKLSQIYHHMHFADIHICRQRGCFHMTSYYFVASRHSTLYTTKYLFEKLVFNFFLNLQFYIIIHLM